LCERFNEPAAAPTATLSDAAERRRYALLQAAAVILSHPDENGEFPLPESAVKSAQNLLAIIERRELERANG